MSSISSSRIKVEVVCFSKERPFQLCECLSSLSQTFLPHDSYDLHTNVILDPKNYEAHYMEVERRHPGVDFLYETKEADFLLLLHQILSPSSSSSSSSPSFVLFLVDDLIFHSSVNLIDFLTLLNHDPSLFNAHLKLHPGIQFSHPASKVNIPPQLHAFPSSSSALQFSLTEGTGDWAYPIDLCGGLYRTADLLSLLSHSRSHLDILPIRNPNTLEVSLNKAFQSSPELCMHKYSSSLCSSSPLLSVLTINRVQTTYNVPIYNSAYNDLELLNSFFYSEQHFDLSRYAAMLSSSVHIGDVFFLESPSLSISIPYSSSSSPLISVLIPTFNAAKTIQQSILSILDSVTRYPFEVVIVNDGSNDNTVDIFTSLQAIAASRSIPFQVLNIERKGLINALESGLQHCSAPFIARMDADDIADSHRLDRQLRFLLANPVINVVGSQAALLTSSEEKGSFKEELLNVALMQIHPILIEWEMLFKCPCLHPSIMFRKEIILSIGSYAQAISTPFESIEDYFLYSRLLQRHPFSISNLPDVLLQLRISSSSKSSREKIILTKASQDLRFQNLLYLLKYENTRSIDECCQDDHVKQCEDALAEVFRCVVFPKQHIQQAPQMHAAIQLIHRMQVCYQNKINQYCARKNEEEKSEDSYMAILKILFHLQRQRIYQVLKFAAQNCNCIVECLPYLKSIDIAPKDFLREVMVNSGILKGYF